MRRARARRARARAGFTLLELLIAVAIVGILAAIAVPAFIGQMRRAQMLDAFRMIDAIRIAEVTWYGRHNQYLAVGFNPAATPRGTTLIPWDTTDPGWRRLGVVSDGPQRFQYRVLAGGPSDPPPGGVTLPADEPWFVVQALGDLDGDMTDVFVESYSEGEAVYIGRGLGGPFLADGWE